MASADEYASWIVKNQDRKGTPEFDTVAQAYKQARQETQVEKPSTLDVVKNAAYKGVAAIPDMFLNAPTHLLNFGKMAVGQAAIDLGRPDLAPEMSPPLDLARRGAEAIGLIDPKIQPQGATQKITDALTQGATGGALTGGASVPGVIAGAGMGALSAGTAEAVKEGTGSNEAAIVAAILAPKAAAKTLGGLSRVPKDVQLLNDEGVSMTPGRMLGGGFQRAEDMMTSSLLMGDAIKGAHRRGHETFDTAFANRALKPIDEKLPTNIKGHDAVAYVEDKLGSRYDALRNEMHGSLDGPIRLQPALPATPGQQAPVTLRQELAKISEMGQNLPPAQQGQLDRIIKNEVLDRFTDQGRASGETIKNIESKLGKMASAFGRSDNYDVRTLAGAVQETKAALKRMVERENPTHAEELSKINEGWSIFKRLQVAAASPAAKDGIATPTQLHLAVKAQDRSKDHSKFARGEALMQDLTNAGKNVLSPTVPDSGTALRQLSQGGIVGAMTKLADPRFLVGAAGGAAAYSPAMQKIIQAIMLGKQGPVMRDAAKRSLIPLAGQENQY